MELYKSIIGPKSGPVTVILHGLFGSHRNWQTIAKTLSLKLNGPVVCVDLRNHGKSVKFDELGRPYGMPMNWEGMTGDIQKLLREIKSPVNLIGHSLGGQLAIQTLFRIPEIPIRKLVIVDIAPVPIEPSTTTATGSVLKYIEIMQLVDKLGLPRNEALYEFRKLLKGEDQTEEPIIQFLFTNYGRFTGGQQYGFTIPLESIKNGILELGNTFYHKMFNNFKTSDQSSLFIKGAKSNYIDGKGIDRINDLFLNYRIETMANSGHWPHYEEPVEFSRIITEFIMTDGGRYDPHA